MSMREKMVSRRDPRSNTVCIVYDARGNGSGQTSPTITGGHQASISDYTAIVLEIIGGDDFGENNDIRKTTQSEDYR